MHSASVHNHAASTLSSGNANPTDGTIARAPEDVCILVATFAPNLAAARLTLRLLDRYWTPRPATFLCGVEATGPANLPFDQNPADWMATVRSAVGHLGARGFTRVYLILDDQGPMDQCHVHHLNQTVPGWMTELNAVYISIRGWDHRRNSSGKSLGRRFLSLQQQSPDYPWRFALHPALWRIDALVAILDRLMNTGDPAERTAWDFERNAGNLNDELPRAWNEGTYRVCGRLMSANPSPTAKRLFRHCIDSSVRAIDRSLERFLFLSKWPPVLKRAVAHILKTDAVYYQGPYPMHFSGFLLGGRINPHLISFLRARGRYDLVREIEATSPTLIT